MDRTKLEILWQNYLRHNHFFLSFSCNLYKYCVSVCWFQKLEVLLGESMPQLVFFYGTIHKRFYNNGRSTNKILRWLLSAWAPIHQCLLPFEAQWWGVFRLIIDQFRMCSDSTKKCPKLKNLLIAHRHRTPGWNKVHSRFDSRPFNLHLDFWKSRSWKIKVCF